MWGSPSRSAISACASRMTSFAEAKPTAMPFTKSSGMADITHVAAALREAPAASFSDVV